MRLPNVSDTVRFDTVRFDIVSFLIKCWERAPACDLSQDLKESSHAHSTRYIV